MTDTSTTPPDVHPEGRRALNAIGRPVYLKDIDERIVFANEHFAELLGYTPEQITGQKERELLGNDNADALAEGAALIFAGQHQEVSTDISIVDAYDSMRLCHIRQLPYASEARGMLVLSVLRDVTEERQIEEALRSSEEYSRSFLESSQDCIAHLASDGTFLSVNQAGCSMLGLEQPEDIAGRELSEFCAEIAEECSTAVSRALAGTQIRFEKQFRRADSRMLWLDVRLTPIKDLDGSMRGILLVGRDITEQRAAEAELKKLWVAVEQNPSSIVITNTNGIIEYVNPKFCDVTGYSREEAIGRNPRILKSGEMSRENYRDLWETILAGQAWHGEFHNRKKNGELFWEAASISPIRNAEGKITSFIAVKEDITERKKLETQLQEDKKQLEQAYADLQKLQSQLLQQEKMSSIGQLAAGVAHEINNPMGFIISNLGALRRYARRRSDFMQRQMEVLEKLFTRVPEGAGLRDELLTARKAAKIDYINDDIENLVAESLDGAERVKRIVQDLKGFSRIDEAESKMADINAGLESTINIVWNEIKYKASVRKEFGDLPQTKCNPGQLNQVFMNMLINAVQAIPERGEIRVKTWRDEGDIFISISDTGIGIPPDKIGRIFDPFFTTKDVGKGTGLGLSIAYDIIKKHDGEITVKSVQGSGTTFTVCIPVVEG